MTTTLATPPVDDLDHAEKRWTTMAWIAGFTLALAVTIVVATGSGPVSVPPSTVARIVGHHLLGWPGVVDWTRAEDSIVWQVRTPRVLLGASVGAALAVSGVVLQTIIRNALADPHILGVTSGASTGAAVCLLFGSTVSASAAALTSSAFLGAMIATALLFVVARINGRMTSLRLLLGGVTIGYIFSAATSFLIFASDSPEGARAVLFWLLGSLSSAAWSSVAVTTTVVFAFLGALFVMGTRFDALSVGDDTALTLGFSPVRLRVGALGIVALGVGAVVAVSGAIGFVGLIIPHVARLCVGSTHRKLIPVSALIGAIFLVAADVVARTAFAPRELPLGIVTAVVGAPLLLVLIRRMRGVDA
ncbi:FecCD family ABC transporter permease [Nocardia shimofusensis]|uniref:FecCD family ABC transporter permease n=1 Tax=Nocardia shimofusensis TaxID=228596 RepID=UPI000AEC22D2|nr:iron ABC transporter permease [Nocardia shimofusensis]